MRSESLEFGIVSPWDYFADDSSKIDFDLINFSELYKLTTSQLSPIHSNKPLWNTIKLKHFIFKSFIYGIGQSKF